MIAGGASAQRVYRRAREGNGYESYAQDETSGATEVLVVNKLDLLPYVDYDMANVRRHALAVNPRPRVFELSCRTGEGLGIWCDWILAHVRVDGR